jgi:hypothetical protein
MRVRGTLHWKGIIWTLCWWSLRGGDTRINRSINRINARIRSSSINTDRVLAKTEGLSKFPFASLLWLMNNIRLEIKFSGMLNHHKNVRCIVTSTRRSV